MFLLPPPPAPIRARFGLKSYARAAVVLPLALGLQATAAQATVYWEDFQGRASIGTDDGKNIGTFDNDAGGSGNSAQGLANFRAVAANLANVERQGTNPNIDFLQSSNTLCNSNVAEAGNEACLRDIQGRAIYALIKFPTAGTYTFYFTHDDGMEVNFATDYTVSNFRNAVYDLPIPALTSYTSSDTQAERISRTVTANQANSCMLMRVNWYNYGGVNHLRMYWTTQTATTDKITVGTSGTTLVPSTALFDPRLGHAQANCSGTVTSSGTTPSLRVVKVVGADGRASSSDQFTLTARNGNTVLGSVTTNGTGTGTANSASTPAISIANNTTYTITETMAAGSGYTLGAYSPTVICTRTANNGNVTTETLTPTSAGVWSISNIGNNVTAVCTVTNNRRSAQLRVGKQWTGAVVNDRTTIPAPTGTATASTVYTSTAAAAAQTGYNTPFKVLVGETVTLQPETLATSNSGNYLGTVSCDNSLLASASARQTNSFTIPESITSGAQLSCLYLNQRILPLAILKSSIVTEDPIRGTTNPLMIPGARVRYTITVTNPNNMTIDPGSIAVVDPTPAHLRFAATHPTNSGQQPVQFVAGGSGLSFSYSALNNASDDLDFSNDLGASWSYAPTPDADGSDANVTQIRMRPKGAMNPNSNFSVSFDYVIE